MEASLIPEALRTTMPRRLRSTLSGVAKGGILRLKRFRPEDALVLTSEPRAGSTWLMQQLSRLPKTVINWEPLHHNEGVVPKELQWGSRPYIPPDEDDRCQIALLEDILSYRRSNRWTRQYASVEQALQSQTVLVKSVRANMLLPWLLRHIMLKQPPILLHRHPVATCVSQLRAFGAGGLQDLVLPGINNQRYHAALPLLRTLTSELELKVAWWCLNNVTTIDDPLVAERCIQVWYEELLLDPEAVRTRVFRQLGYERYFLANRTSFDFRGASPTDFRGDFDGRPAVQLAKSLRGINNQMKHRIQRIFDYFGLAIYNAFEPLPRHISHWEYEKV